MNDLKILLIMFLALLVVYSVSALLNLLVKSLVFFVLEKLDKSSVCAIYYDIAAKKLISTELFPSKKALLSSIEYKKYNLDKNLILLDSSYKVFYNVSPRRKK